jgi:hypothetical protein
MTTATIALAVYIQITLAVKFPIVRTQYSAGALSSISCVYIRQGRTAHAHTPTHCLDFVNHQRSPSLVLFLNVLRLDFCRLGDRWSGTSRVRPSGPCSFTPYDKKKKKKRWSHAEHSVIVSVGIGKKDDGADQKKRRSIFTYKRQQIVLGSPTPFVFHRAYAIGYSTR